MQEQKAPKVKKPRPKVTKFVTITALFPEMKGGRAHQQGRGQASTLAGAFARAGKNLFKQPGLRKQRYTQFSATFTIGTIKEEEPQENQ